MTDEEMAMADERPIAAIKMIRERTKVGLFEAKNRVDHYLMGK